MISFLTFANFSGDTPTKLGGEIPTCIYRIRRFTPRVTDLLIRPWNINSTIDILDILYHRLTGAKPVLGPNCMIPYRYGIMQFGPSKSLAFVHRLTYSMWVTIEDWKYTFIRHSENNRRHNAFEEIYNLMADVVET